MPKARISAVMAFVISAAQYSAFGADAQTAPTTTASSGHATVLWISCDGFRHDYVEKNKPAFIGKMMKEGAYSTHMQTIFPTLTFPSHVAEVTGQDVAHHGIPANDFFDRVTNKTWAFPPDGTMLLAEPIWTTSTRQGVRTEVLDWPLSQMETGANAAAVFNHEKFNGSLSGQQRLDRLVSAYEGDTGTPPLRLIMGYIEGTDHSGHRSGPDSRENAAEVKEVDGLLASTFARVYKDFEAKRTSPNDTFYFLMSTDHGMATVKTLVRLDFVLGLLPHDETKIVTSGPLANVYLPAKMADGDRENIIAAYLEKIKAKGYMHAWRREDVPKEWGYVSEKNEARVGDIVVMLNEPYTWSSRIPEAEYDVSKGGGPLGMHGYIVEQNPDMEGFTMMWRSSGNWGGKDLGVVKSRQFHATVAHWLGIQPADGAMAAIDGAQ